MEQTGSDDLLRDGLRTPARVTGNTVNDGVHDAVIQAGHVEGGLHITLAPAQHVPSALRQLPPLPVGFTGRTDEQAAVLRVLDPAAPHEVVAVSMAGLAGVGKTTLAVRAAHAALERGWFPGGVLFIDMHGYDKSPVEAGQALDSLLRALGVAGERIPPGVDDRAGLYRSILAALPEPVLVIVDNASSAGQVRPLLPGELRHRLLATSRHTLPQFGARLLDLALLPAADAIELLDAALRAADPSDGRIRAEAAAAEAVAECCGFLPLGLQIAAALLAADPGKPVSELAAEFAGARDCLAYLDDGERAVRAAFDLSYQLLPAEQARLFGLLALDPGPDVATSSAAVLANHPEPLVQSLLEGLARAHLVERAAERGRWRMHDLIRLYATDVVSGYFDEHDREQARDRLFDHYLDRARAADQHLRALRGVVPPAPFSGWRDAVGWLDAERATLTAATSLAADTGRDAVACDLSAALAEYFSRCRRLDDWLATTATAVEAARRLGDRAREGVALTDLGIVLRQVRRFDEAIAAHKQHVAICRDFGDQRGEGTALANLGIVLRKARRFDEGIAVCQEAADVCRRLGDRQGEATALTNLSLALPWARCEEAITAGQDAVAIFRELDDRLHEAKALHSLSVALTGAERYPEAIAVARDAAAIFREFGGRRDEAVALNTIGDILRRDRQFEEAITTHRLACAILQETGDRHDEARTLANLGTALYEVGRFEQAATAARAASAIFHDLGDGLREALATDNLCAAEQRSQGQPA